MINYLKKNQLKFAPIYFLAPTIILFLLYVIYPIIDSIWVSFHSWNGMDRSLLDSSGDLKNWKWVGLDNYKELFFEDYTFPINIINNLKWLILSLLVIPIGLGLAIFLNQNIREMKFIKPLFFFPFVINLVVVSLIFTWFYMPKYGLLDLIFRSLGLEPIAFLAEETLATYAIIFAFFWPAIAYTMIIYLTGLTNINTEVVEAGRIDGASGFNMFWNVILPQLRPATFIATVVTIVGALRSFDMVAIMTKGGPWGSSSVLAYKMYEEALFSYRMGYGSAIATILFLIMDIYIAWFLYRLFINESSEK
tara:strand:+ start:1589 stop:2509 length:921 start_codon:yes stop_codon:yes gene_type:complete